MKNRLLPILGLLIVSSLKITTPNAYAETLVYPDQYIISRFTVARSAQVAPKKANANYLTKPITNKLELAEFKSSQLGSALRSSSLQQPVSYQPDLDRCKELMLDPEIADCSPNYAISLNHGGHQSQASSPPMGYSLGSDSRQWGLLAANAEEAWSTTTGSEEVVVAVLDTGIDYNHPDLKGNLWVNQAETPDNGIDDDRNGYTDDYYGINSAVGTGDPWDDHGHGTHVAGIIGADGFNTIGTVGVNWRVKIMSLKFLDSRGLGSLASAIQALNYLDSMRERGVNIRLSNNSWGGAPYSQMLYDVVEKLDKNGVIFVAAAGNIAADNDSSEYDYPASLNLPGVISVASVNQLGKLSSFSNFGVESVHLAAPGEAIYSTFTNGGYEYLSGTSMATPFVSGALALALSIRPDAKNSELISLLLSSTDSSVELVGKTRTGGTLNIGRFISELLSKSSGSKVPSTKQSDSSSENDDSEQAEITDLKLKLAKAQIGKKSAKEIHNSGAKKRELIVSYRADNPGQVELKLRLNGAPCADSLKTVVQESSGELVIRNPQSWSKGGSLRNIVVADPRSGRSAKLKLPPAPKSDLRNFSSRTKRLCRGVKIETR